MKIKLDASELYTYQQEAEERMQNIEEEYTKLLSPVCDNTNILLLLWGKFKSLFIWSPSLRFYNLGEELTKDKEILHKAKVYRALWHNYWSVVNLFPTISNKDTNQGMLLDSYETEVILSLRRYREEIKTF